MTLDRQRYSISSRTQLNDQLSRLLGHLVSPSHHDQFKCAVLREFWGLEDARHIFSLVLTSSLKKLVSRDWFCGFRPCRNCPSVGVSDSFALSERTFFCFSVYVRGRDIHLIIFRIITLWPAMFIVQ